MSMRVRSLATIAGVILSSSCYALGIDFDKTGVTSSSSAGTGGQPATTGVGVGGEGATGSGGAGGGATAPDCGGVDLLTDLANSPYYRANGNLPSNGCDAAWNGVANTANLVLPAVGATAESCRVATNWYFDGRGRRFAAHLASPVSAIGIAPAGLVALDPNGFEVLALFHSDGSVWVSTQDIGTGAVNQTGPINVGSDRYLALRFSNDGSTVSFDSSAQQGSWVERKASIDLSQFSSAFNAASVKVGVIETGAANSAGGSADFDSIHGETIASSTAQPVACPISSLKASFNLAGLPDSLSDPNACSTAGGSTLRLCSGAKPCVVSSRHLYDLNGSRLDAQVTNISADTGATFVLGAFAPRVAMAVVPVAQMQLTTTDLQAGANTVMPIAGPLTLPLYLDMLSDGMGSVEFGTHVTANAPPMMLGSTPITPPTIVEIRLTVPAPHACVTIDNLGLP